jgi:GalNAc-alpha-(1->4)-GalNAc-alpha-(1->3)-diNAcBac-PP-undecaprenol alpha-1,4-N-acetyl-D-galactosaminyltransferase
LGEVDNVDLLLASASIYVLPSVLEGFPNALCEAMAGGLPVIAFDSIPYESIVDNGVNGIILKERTPANLAREIDRLVLGL